MSDQLLIIATELIKKIISIPEKMEKRYFEKDILQAKKEMEDSIEKKSMKHCIKCNEELENDALYCSECGVPQSEPLPMENNIKDKFIEAANQSKVNSDGYILMNEFAMTLRNLGVKWEGKFISFLKNYENIIEFKSDTQHYAQAIKIKCVPENNNIDTSKASEKTDFLEQTIKNADKIYIDTCSLMEMPVDIFFKKANIILKRHKKKIVVPIKVELELKRIAKNREYELRQQKKAKNALEELYPEMNEIEIIGEDGDNERTADQVFKYVFEKYRHKYKMLLISQDSKLSDEITNLNYSEAVRGKKCTVCRIDNDGNLYEYEG